MNRRPPTTDGFPLPTTVASGFSFLGSAQLPLGSDSNAPPPTHSSYQAQPKSGHTSANSSPLYNPLHTSSTPSWLFEHTLLSEGSHSRPNVDPTMEPINLFPAAAVPSPAMHPGDPRAEYDRQRPMSFPSTYVTPPASVASTSPNFGIRPNAAFSTPFLTPVDEQVAPMPVGISPPTNVTNAQSQPPNVQPQLPLHATNSQPQPPIHATNAQSQPSIHANNVQSQPPVNAKSIPVVVSAPQVVAAVAGPDALDFYSMNRTDLIQAALKLEDENRQWRAAEKARFEDDTDPFTIKTFLRMANDEVDRLRKRETELLALLNGCPKEALQFSVQLNQFKSREAQLLAQVQSAQSEVRSLQEQLKVQKEREAKLMDEVQLARTIVRDMQLLHTETEMLKEELNTLREACMPKDSPVERPHAVEIPPPPSASLHTSSQLPRLQDESEIPLQQAAENRKAPFFGLEVSDGAKYQKDFCDTSSAYGAIKVVYACGPAEQAGLRPGDMITTVNGTPVTNFQEFNRVLSQVWAGDVVSMVFERDGQSLHTAVHTESPPVKPGQAQPPQSET